MLRHRERSRAAGGQREPRGPEILFPFSPAPGGSDAKDAFQHAAFEGNRKKRQKQRGRRGSAAGIQEPERNLNQETGMPMRLSDEPPKKRPTAMRDKEYLFQKALLYPLVLGMFLNIFVRFTKSTHLDWR